MPGLEDSSDGCEGEDSDDEGAPRPAASPLGATDDSVAVRPSGDGRRAATEEIGDHRMLRDSRGKQALHICMSYHVFSVILPLSMHPRCKLGTALRLRALCRSAARPASGVHLRVCWQLMQHTNNEVREHVTRMIGEQRSHNIWNSSCGRADSEVTNAAESRGDGPKGLDEEPPPPVRHVTIPFDKLLKRNCFPPSPRSGAQHSSNVG